MRVALDTSGLYVTRAGVARYLRGLLSGFRALAPADLDLTQLAWPVENFAYAQPLRAMKTVYRELIWTRATAPRILSGFRPDVLHMTSALHLESRNTVKRVLTFYDFAMLRHPERFRRWHRASRRRFLRGLLARERFDHFICISRFTADEAMRLLSLPASRITVVHCGCDFHPDEPQPAEEKPAFDLPAEFFLFVGSLEPGKNLALLGEAYGLARQTGVHLPSLVIVGQRWEGVPTEGRGHPDWRYVGRQPDTVLAHLYRRATALVFPSKYEGFGLPVVEAMALHCPVICSPVASLPEVAGDAALFAALTARDYLNAMQRISSDTALRADLIARGDRQAHTFSWRRCAAETLDVYRRVTAS